MPGQSILIVDDDRSIANAIRTTLETEGYTVDIAETGREAIEKSATKIYDLALLDIRLPDMDGCEVLRIMRARTPRTAVIILTGYLEPRQPAGSSTLGADGYLVKPVDVEELLEIINQKLIGR